MMKWYIFFIVILFSFKSLGQKEVQVFFDFNEDFPNQNSILELNEWIAKNKDIEITKLLGFCDSIDSKEYNIQLATRRIESIQVLLSKSGLKFNENLEKTPFGKDFKQSKIQAENRKVIISYKDPILLPQESELTKRIKSSKIGDFITVENIYFYNNSSRILPRSQPTLYDLLCALEENPKLKIEIQGHICCQKEGDINDVSTRRARAMYNFLIRNKIPRNRMSYKGFGTLKPIHPIPEKTEKEEEENRRVEILIVEK